MKITRTQVRTRLRSLASARDSCAMHGLMSTGVSRTYHPVSRSKLSTVLTPIKFYTHTFSLDSEISDTEDPTLTPNESISDRLYALKDIIPPKTRANLSRTFSTISNATNTTITYGGKTLWVVATSILLLGIPYALALGEEQQVMEEERQRGIMERGQEGMLSAGAGEGKPAL
jgi:mitochondrial import receptor subunit TOM22